MKKQLKVVALLEALSFLVLLGFTVLKHTTGPATGVQLFGPVHGALFVAYVVLTVVVARAESWKLTRTLLTLGCAVLPLGGLIADRTLIGPVDEAVENTWS